MEEDSVLIDCHESEHPSEAKQGQQYHGHLNTAPVRTKETTRRTLKMVSNEKSETGLGGGVGETLRACEARARESMLPALNEFVQSAISISFYEVQEKNDCFSANFTPSNLKLPRYP